MAKRHVVTGAAPDVSDAVPPATNAPAGLVGRMIDARWRVVEELGPTAHGTALRVEDAEHGRPARLDLWEARHVAERGRMAQIERRARIVSGLQHPRCLPLRQFGVEDGRPFFVTDLSDGQRVAELLGGDALTVRRAIAIALQVLDGLRHLHAHGVAHRAISPETVWLGTSLTGEAVSLGPPQLGGTGNDWADTRGDLHAVGLLLYAMCVGRTPAASVPSAPYPAPRSVAPDRGIGEATERVIMRAIAPSKEARFQTADDFIAALQRMDPALPRPKPPAVSPLPKRRTHPALLAGGVAVVALVGLVAVLRGRGSTPVSPEPRTAPPAAVPVTAPSPPAAPPAPPVAARPAPPPVAAPPTPPPVAAPPTPPVAAIPAPSPAAAPPPAPRTAEGIPPTAVRAEFWDLLRRGQLEAAEARIAPLLTQHPEAAWPHAARAEIFFQRHWRRDAVREWTLALERDRALMDGTHFGTRLCRMLDAQWNDAGADRLIALVGKKVVPLLRQCAAKAETPALRAQAARALSARQRR